MTTLYWLVEYGKVLFAYLFIFFIWPSVIFKKFLHKKTLTFRFGFCVTTQIVLVNTAVLMLGLVHMLNPWLISFLFYGSFLYCVISRIPNKKEEGKRILHVLSGTLGIKSYCYHIGGMIVDVIKNAWKRFLKAFQGRFWEYSILAIVVLFGVIFFSYGAFQDYSYGCGDLYPHNAWIYGLTKGEIFSAGVYPEGMHCMIYAMHELFHIRIYSCLLFLQGIHVFVLLVSVYMMFREIFRWRYIPILVVALFLTLDVVNVDAVYAMSRLQWTLPQEFTLFAPFMCVTYLIRYLRGDISEEEQVTGKYKWLKRLFANENLLVFWMAIAASLVAHFYTTIMAFFLCVAFVPVAVRKIFTPKRFVTLVLAVVMGTTVAVVPMIGALASGIPFQGSIGWALNVMSGEDKNSGDDAENEENSINEEDSFENQDASNIQEEAVSTETEAQEVYTQDETNADSIRQVPKESLIKRIKKLVKAKASIVYELSYIKLFKQKRGVALLWITVLSFVVFCVMRIGITLIAVIKRKKEMDCAQFDHYVSIILATILFMVIYCAGALGFPQLIEGSRVIVIIQIMMIGMCFICVDAVSVLFIKIASQKLQNVIGAALVGVIYVFTQATGTFHGFQHYEITRYNSAVMVTYDITEQFPDFSYTIVSTVDELYQMIQYGYHEELVNFTNNCTNRFYKLPTEYVFIYLEKKPMQRSQIHFFNGPKWLGDEKYPQYYGDYVTQCPDIKHSELYEDTDELLYTMLPVATTSYADLESRAIIESKLNWWCKEFSRLYPGELHTYYEDDNFVCYYFKQNPACIYRLGFPVEEHSEN
ncbi:MAG: hypothetical protein Q4D51_02635 [Eubacteriales bacterium]|nr:hypothetical protein [Eubacteriales bacterium]